MCFHFLKCTRKRIFWNVKSLPCYEFDILLYTMLCFTMFLWLWLMLWRNIWLQYRLSWRGYKAIALCCYGSTLFSDIVVLQIWKLISSYFKLNIINHEDDNFLDILDMIIFNFCDNFAYYWCNGILFETTQHIYKKIAPRTFYLILWKTLCLAEGNYPLLIKLKNYMTFSHVILWPTNVGCKVQNI